MPESAKRKLVGRGKGYLSSAGTQFRFIVFLIFLLIAYTFLLRVFQKMAEIVQFPVFFPIALITLLIFIGIVGILYSHTFVGPLMRILRALEHLAEGDTNISLRLRDSDDPVLKELVRAITRVGEHGRNTHALIQETSQELFADIAALQDKINKGADRADILKHLDGARKKQDLLEKAIKSLGKT